MSYSGIFAGTPPFPRARWLWLSSPTTTAAAAAPPPPPLCLLDDLGDPDFGRAGGYLGYILRPAAGKSGRGRWAWPILAFGSSGSSCTVFRLLFVLFFISHFRKKSFGS
jgi:hypothetical protein